MNNFKVYVKAVKTYEMIFEDVEAADQDEANRIITFHIDRLRLAGLEDTLEKHLMQIDSDIYVDVH